MSITGWLVLGLVAGFLASRIYGVAGQAVVLDVVLGVVGAVVGGLLFDAVGAVPVTAFDPYSMVSATVGAIVVPWVYHAVMDRRSLQ